MGAETTTDSHHHSTTFQTLPSANLFDAAQDKGDLEDHLDHLFDHLDLFDPRSERVDGSGRVTSWGKSWETTGDGSTHRPSILPPNFALSPDFIRRHPDFLPSSVLISCLPFFSILSTMANLDQFKRCRFWTVGAILIYPA